MPRCDDSIRACRVALPFHAISRHAADDCRERLADFALGSHERAENAPAIYHLRRRIAIVPRWLAAIAVINVARVIPFAYPMPGATMPLWRFR